MTNRWNCVLLADQHHGLRDSVRGLLEMEFDTVFMVATEAALLEGAERLNPVVVVVDLSLAAGDLSGLLHRIGARAPGAKLLLLSVHDEGTVADAALAAGADGVVLKRCLVTDLMPAVNAVLAGKRYLSSGISR
jgi:two-component system nitrate/nitrite response regulator NarL